MSGPTDETAARVIVLAHHRRARSNPRRDLCIAALLLGALLALLFALPRPFAARARAEDEPAPSALRE